MMGVGGGFLWVLRFPQPINNKTDPQDLTEIFLKMALNTLTLILSHGLYINI
jgi:hypothetical protein